MTTNENDSETCHFCNEDDYVALDEHHVIPRRLTKGRDNSEIKASDRTVTICSNCHRKVHHAFVEPVIKVMSDRIKQRADRAEHTADFTTASELAEVDE